MQRSYSKYSSPATGQLEKALYQQNEYWPLCPLLVYPLVIKLGLLDGWNPSVFTGKEPEVFLIMYHLRQSSSRTSAFRFECFVWPARFSHIYPCNCLGILIYFCVLEISLWFVCVFPLNFGHFMANLSRTWKMPALFLCFLWGRLCFY